MNSRQRVWVKKGCIFECLGLHPKLLTHSANPLPVHLSGDVFRIFYSSRDKLNRSSVGAFDFDVKKRIVIEDYTEPFFEHGPVGSFYENGVSIGNCYSVDGRTYMLFMGWQNPVDAHWRGDIGRLELTSGKTLHLDREMPFISGEDFQSISLSYPWVEGDANGDYHMWYGTTETWDAGNNEMLHIIKSAISDDGHIWTLSEQTIPFEIGVAQAFSRPTVLNHSDGTKDMWFSYRSGDGTTYRIGNSHYANGRWSALPSVPDITVSDEGWDSEMIEYPFVFKHDGLAYMLYNGNGYGKSGIGLAEWEQ